MTPNLPSWHKNQLQQTLPTGWHIVPHWGWIHKIDSDISPAHPLKFTELDVWKMRNLEPIFDVSRAKYNSRYSFRLFAKLKIWGKRFVLVINKQLYKLLPIGLVWRFGYPEVNLSLRTQTRKIDVGINQVLIITGRSDQGCCNGF